MSRTGAVRAPRTRTIVLTCIGLLSLVLAAFAWVAVRANLAKGELEALVPIARDVQAAAGERDLDRLARLVDELGRHAGSAAALTGDPLWGVASAMPVLGANFAAVHTVSASVDDISQSGIGSLIGIAQEIQGGGGSGGSGFDVATVQRASGPLDSAAAAFAKASHALASIRSDELLPPLESGVTALADAVETASPLVTSIAQLAGVMPGILGADGPRTILVMMQNPAEPRTGGGITGSFALLSADDGDLSVVDQAESGGFPSFSSPIVPIPGSTQELFGDVVGRFVVNASMTTDFALTGRLASAWWQARTGTAPDAVVSIDPEVLAALLSVAGPVSLPDGAELDSGDLVETLLVDAYFDLDRDEQTILQQSVTTAVVSQVLSGGLDMMALVEALQPTVEDGRISLWSAHEDEQARISSGPFAGPAARHEAAGDGAFAVYVNDRTGGKMGMFLETEMAVDAVECRPDGRQDVVVRVALTNTAPLEAVDFPWWVNGGGLEGVPPGDIGVDVTVAAPPGSFFGGVRLDGALVRSTNVEDVGFPSSLGAATISPGGSATLDFRFFVDGPGARAPVLVLPPLLNAAEVDDGFVAACAG